MTNTTLPSGFTPRNLAAWTRYYIPQSDGLVYRVGDVVKSAGGTDATGVITVTQHTGAGAARGVIVSVDPGLPATGGLQSNGVKLWVPAVKAKDYYVWVVDDPQAKFSVVDDGLTPSSLIAGNVGSFVNFTPGVSASANGGSTSVLTSSTFGGAAGAGCLKVQQLLPGSNYGANATWIVQFAMHELAQGGAGGGAGGVSKVANKSPDGSGNVVLAVSDLLGSTQAAQIAAGATAALLNAAKTALKDPAGGADISLGGTGGGNFTLAAWDANNPPAAVQSGVAPTGTQPTAYVVISSGVVAVSGPDAITALRTNDVVEWVAASSTWVREAGPVPDPITVSASLTLTPAHNDVGLILATTQTITLNDGMGSGFSLPIKGPYTLAGTAVVNPLRRSTGLSAASLWSFLIKTGNNGTHDTYDQVGDTV